MRSVTIVLLAGALLLGGCAKNRDLIRPSPGVETVLAREADGSWLLEYRFTRPAPAWFFVRSALDLDGKPWRPQSLAVETPGVRLERQGRYDVLTGDGTPLTAVRLRMKPYGDALQADYTPVLRFSDGGLAIYSEHYLVAPLASAAAAAALPGDLNGVTFDTVPVQLAIRDPGRTLLLRGKTYRGEAKLWLNERDAYIYSGPAKLVDTSAFAGIVDPALPAPVRAELDAFMPRLMAYYTERLGQPATGRPTALVSWGGAAFKGSSLGGSVLAGMVVMDIKGTKVAEADPAVLTRLRWFLGHESAHFWMGQTVRYSRRHEAWILEGAADLMAVRAFKHLDPGYDDRAELQREVDDCIKVNGTNPLSSASDRDAHRANYACGAVLLMAAEGMMRRRDPDADVFTWLKRLIDANRADGVVTQAKWIEAFDAVAADREITARLRAFIDKGAADPADFVHHLLAAAGVAVRREDGRVLLN